MFLKQSVDVGAVATEFAGKPRDAAFLTKKFFTNYVANRFHRVFCV